MSVKVLGSIAVLVLVVVTIVVLLWRKKLREAVALAVVGAAIAVFARPVEVAWDAMLTEPTPTPASPTASAPVTPPPTSPSTSPRAPRPSTSSGTPRRSTTPPPRDPSPRSDTTPVADDPTPETTVAPRRATPPRSLLGTWSGGGNQYPNDGFYQSVDVDFGDDGRYALVLGGALHDGGRYAVDRDAIEFRSTQTGPYIWGWAVEEFGGAPLLVLRNEYGGTYRLDRR